MSKSLVPVFRWSLFYRGGKVLWVSEVYFRIKQKRHKTSEKTISVIHFCLFVLIALFIQFLHHQRKFGQRHWKAESYLTIVCGVCFFSQTRQLRRTRLSASYFTISWLPFELKTHQKMRAALLNKMRLVNEQVKLINTQ